MKVVIINGSPRKNGATAKLLEQISLNLAHFSDVEIKYYHISDFQLNFCKGCCKCYELGKCIMDDDIEKLSGQIAESDGLIIGTPVYASNISAQLKLLIDRGHFVIEQLLKSKVTFAVVTYENSGGSTALNVIKRLFLFSGSKYNLNMKVKIPFNQNPLQHEVIRNKLETCSRNFYYALTSIKTSYFRKLLQNIIFNIGIKPFVRSKGNKYAGVLNRWRELGIKIN